MKEMRIRANRTKRGILLVDVLTALFILAMGALALFATIGVAGRAAKQASDQGKATYIATKYIEQLQSLSTTSLTPATLSSLNLIDQGQTSSPYSFSNVPLDDGSYYSPAKMLRDGTAWVSFTNIDSGSVRCNILIRWTTPNGVTQNLKTGTIIGSYH